MAQAASLRASTAGPRPWHGWCAERNQNQNQNRMGTEGAESESGSEPAAAGTTGPERMEKGRHARHLRAAPISNEQLPCRMSDHIGAGIRWLLERSAKHGRTQRKSDLRDSAVLFLCRIAAGGVSITHHPATCFCLGLRCSLPTHPELGIANALR